LLATEIALVKQILFIGTVRKFAKSRKTSKAFSQDRNGRCPSTLAPMSAARFNSNSGLRRVDEKNASQLFFLR